MSSLKAKKSTKNIKKNCCLIIVNIRYIKSLCPMIEKILSFYRENVSWVVPKIQKIYFDSKS